MLSQAAVGEKLPSLPVLLAYVTACGADTTSWERRWAEAARADAERLPPDSDEEGQAPYQGLTRFETADHERFFGRDRLVEDLRDVLRTRRCVALVGPSGSGKSSLLRAGLIPLLQRTADPLLRPAALRVLTPGEQPLRTHGDVLAPAPGNGDTWLVVDQFEEVFTLCRDSGERAAFIDLLVSADTADSRLRVVLGTRADFYGRCLQHPELVPVLRRASVPIGPMSPQELRETVVKPAAARGLIVERALTARLVEEAIDEPGGLPLLSHVLVETWRRRRGRTLTMGAYEAAGGLHGAIAQTAEQLYATLSSDQRVAARRILLRLITPGQGAPDTRCPVNRSALEGPTANGDEMNTVLDRLARARLITLDQDTVDLAHEALITAWPRLRGWLDEDRERLLLHGRLRQDAQLWQELGNDSGSLYRGARLTEAEEAFGSETARGELTSVEAEFMAAGRAAHARDRRRRRSSAAVVSVLVVLSLMVGVVAWQQNREGDQRRAEAASRRLASLAENMRATDPRTAMRLSAAAWRVRPTDEARAALLGATAQREQDAFAVPGGRDDNQVELSQDGRTMIAASEADRRVESWDVASHRRTGGFRLSEGEMLGGLTPDGRRLLMQGEYGLRMRDRVSGELIGAAVNPRSVGGVFSLTPGGHLVLGESSTSAEQWDLRRGRMAFRHESDDIRSVAVSGDDHYLALCDGRSLQVWDVGPRRRLHTLQAAALSRAVCRAGSQLRFVPGSDRLLLVGEDIRGYDVVTGDKVFEVEYEGTLNGIEFSSDGRFVVAADSEAITLWRAQANGYEIVYRYRLSGETVDVLRIDLEQRVVRYLEGDHGANVAVRTLFLGDAVASQKRAPALGAAFSPDGRRLVTARENGGRVRFEVRPTAGGGRRVTLPSVDCKSGKTSSCWASLAFSGNGRKLAYGAAALDTENEHHLLYPQRIKVWDVRENHESAEFELGAKGRSAPSVALNPDGTSLLALHQEPTPALVRWDIRKGTKTVRPVWDTDTQVWGGTFTRPGSGAMAVRPDGRRLATTFGTIFTLPSGRLAEDATASLTNGTALAYSPDGERLTVGEDTGRVALYDGDARRVASLAGTFSGLDSGSESADALTYSHDGKTLAVGGDEGTVRLWDTASGRPLGGPLPTANNAVTAVAFSEDDRNVLVAGEHVPLSSYAIDPDRAADTVCERARGGLSRSRWETYIPDLPYRDICRNTQ